MKQAVCALIYSKSGKIWGVSRKGQPDQMGLIGGKVDDGETPEEALVRETKEETGMEIVTFKKIFERIDDNFICFTYLCTVKNETISTDEIGSVREVDWNELFNGPFGQYNRELFNAINNDKVC